MKETVEFRVDEQFASLLFAEGEGQLLGNPTFGYDIRKVTIETTDPRYPDVGRLQRELRATKGKPFFYGWHIRRQATATELSQANLLQLTIRPTFEPTGEECGTVYDESTACPLCGSGAAQVSDLRLDLRKAPKNKHLAKTIAQEWVISQHLAELMVDAGLKGFELGPVHHRARYADDAIDLAKLSKGREIIRLAAAAGVPDRSWEFYVWLNRGETRCLLEEAIAEHVALNGLHDRSSFSVPTWHQLIVKTKDAEIVSPTRAGNGPFDDDDQGEYRCPTGHLIGLNLLTAVTVKDVDWSDKDIVCTRQFIGPRRGLLRPARRILISPRFYRLLKSEKISGVEIEVAYKQRQCRFLL